VAADGERQEVTNGRRNFTAAGPANSEKIMDPSTIALMVLALNFADAIFAEAQKKHDAGAMSDAEFEDIKQQREAAMTRARDADNAP
jgi:hypothetical protein